MRIPPVALLGLLALGPAGCEPATATATATTTATATATTTATATATPTATPTATATATTTAPSAAISPSPEDMVLIPAGIFLMGSEMGRIALEEKPAHEAIVASFWLDRTEVTLASYLGCVRAGACTPPAVNNRFCNVAFGAARLDHPVNCIDLRQADAHCRAMGKRLPTEREWEYAAAGGAERRSYSWGEEEPTRERACFAHDGGSCPVASFAAGAFGLFDMTGNVWEWTSSVFAPYPSATTAEPVVEGRHYVYRGGGWSRRFAKWMRTRTRSRYQPHESNAHLGVRCARSVTPLACPTDTEPWGEACVRARGEPLCERGLAWSREAGRCLAGRGATALAVAGVASELPAEARGGEPASAPPATPPTAAVAGPIARARTPELDADCARQYPGRPSAFLYTGGRGFHERRPRVLADGCTLRDVGTHWSSACCP
jgi:formylglycine-generating enzyme required for sulfatase activity